MTEPSPHGSGWGGETALSSWEALMWRADGGDPRTRSTGVLLEVLDEAPDWTRLRREIGEACSRVPRLRQRIVEPALPVVAPRWSADRDFDLDYHLTRIRLPGGDAGGGTDDAELLAHVDRIMAAPLDRTRPPWRMTVVTGLSRGRAALALQVHHVLSDGQGLMQLVGLLHTTTPDATDHPPARRQSVADEVTSTGALADGVRDAVAAVGDDVRGAAGAAWRTVRRAAGDPVGSGRAVADYASSLGRMLTPPDADRSLRSDSRGYATLIHEIALADLKAAATAAGGSLNDAFLAGVLGAFRHHHARGGVVPDRMPLAFPISTRTADDPEGGNRFAGVRFAAPVGEPDPRARMAEIGEFSRRARTEPALNFLDILAPAIGLMPGPALTELSATLTDTTDVQASNFPGPPYPLWLAGARVRGLFPLGPRPGIGAMITLLSYDGTCCLGLTLDPGVVKDRKVFADCVDAGFAEVLALANTPDSK